MLAKTTAATARKVIMSHVIGKLNKAHAKINEVTAS